METWERSVRAKLIQPSAPQLCRIPKHIGTVVVIENGEPIGRQNIRLVDRIVGDEGVIVIAPWPSVLVNDLRL